VNLVLRIGSAVLLLPLVLWILFQGGWWAKGLIQCVSIVCLYEYGAIVAKQDLLGRALLIVVGAFAVFAGIVVDDAGRAMLAPQAAVLVFGVLFTLRPGDFPTAWMRLSTLAFGVFYIGLALVSVVRLLMMGAGSEIPPGWSSGVWLYVVLVATWSNDTFAYFAGRALGRHKMSEKISPKKTWEGFAGGAVGTMGMLFLARAVAPSTFGTFSTVDILFIGLPTALFGPIGDLAESLLKRNFNVKDSGKILPGHGGLLDRIDAVFFVAPWVLAYALFVRPLLSP
jgi:phosphatidate cytidylyltransferase